jgi:hypothetical protein
MARQRSTKPHLSPKARPQAPLKREKPASSQTNISSAEAERLSKLSAQERAAEVVNTGVDAEARLIENWWKGENRNPSSPANSSTSDGNSDSDSDYKKSFFCSPKEAPEAQPSPSVSPSSGPSKSQTPPTGSAKFLHINKINSTFIQE